jgi:two-component system response regulator FlrC
VNGVRVTDAALEEDSVLRVGDGLAIVLRIDAKISSSRELFTTPVPGVTIGPRTRAVWQRLVEVAGSALPVILEGPTGCGKEVFARALHTMSGRKGQYVGVNCAAIPSGLAEAQLFGYARGAFTGADQATGGVFEAAHRGTLLLDEIVDLPLLQQGKLLRVIEEGSVTRLGETTSRRVDVRLVCASQSSLWAEARAGRFRSDLLARLSGATLELPPLRERREEIPRLFLAVYVAAGGDARRLTGAFVERLCLEPWPLNIRELGQAARQAAHLASTEGALTAEHLGVLLERIHGTGRPPPRAVALEHRADRSEATVLGARRAAWLERNRDYLDALLAALARTGNNVAAAARSVGMSHQRATRLLAAEKQLAPRRVSTRSPLSKSDGETDPPQADRYDGIARLHEVDGATPRD